MLSNSYFLAKFGFDTAENEPAKNLQNFANYFPNFAQVKMIAGQLEQAGFEDEVRVLSKFRHPNVPSRLRMMGTVRRAVPGPVYLYTANGILSFFKTSRQVESEI